MYELYALLGVPEEEAGHRIKSILRRDRDFSDYTPETRSPTLKDIMFPESSALLSVSPYNRYLALLIESNGLATAAAKCHMSRMTLYRYLQQLEQRS